MTKISLRAIGPMKLSKKGPLELKDDDWDAEMLQMLQASYREVTGRAMPTAAGPGSDDRGHERVGGEGPSPVRLYN